MTLRRTIVVPCRLERLAALADEVRAIAEPIIGSESALLLDAAVTEICSNIVRHGHPDEPDHEYSVQVGADGDRVDVEIRDRGPAFDFTVGPMPSIDVELDDLPEGGFGMAIVAASMDVFEQRREDGVNVSRVVKRRP